MASSHSSRCRLSFLNHIDIHHKKVTSVAFFVIYGVNSLRNSFRFLKGEIMSIAELEKLNTKEISLLRRQVFFEYKKAIKERAKYKKSLLILLCCVGLLLLFIDIQFQLYLINMIPFILNESYFNVNEIKVISILLHISVVYFIFTSFFLLVYKKLLYSQKENLSHLNNKLTQLNRYKFCKDYQIQYEESEQA